MSTSVGQMAYSIARDLYLVLLFIFILEQVSLSGSDFLHDTTRKAVLTITACVIVVKSVQLFMDRAGGALACRRQNPVRDKKTARGNISGMEWASAEMQGWRAAMEDATRVIASLPEPLAQQAFFGVFDGHGGAQVSAIVSQQLPEVLAECAARQINNANPKANAEASDLHPRARKNGSARGVSAQSPDCCEVTVQTNGSSEQISNGANQSPGDPLPEMLCKAMLMMDKGLRKVGENSPQPNKLFWETAASPNAFNLVGSAAIVALVDYAEERRCLAGTERCGGVVAAGRPRRVVAANVGDSRAILCRSGSALPLSEDHKPEIPSEQERIRRAGGFVAPVGLCHRIDGTGLNLSRAFGDFHYKARGDLPPDEQKVIALPEVCSVELTEQDEFLLLACDGIFELHTSQNAIDIVREGLANGLSPGEAVAELLDRSCSSNLLVSHGKGSDNCSAIVILLR